MQKKPLILKSEKNNHEKLQKDCQDNHTCRGETQPSKSQQQLYTSLFPNVKRFTPGSKERNMFGNYSKQILT